MKNAKKYGGTLLMKNKILALVLAGTMLFGQNVYATELVTPENNDVTENKNNVVQDIDKSGTEESAEQNELYSDATNENTQIVYVGNPIIIESKINYGREPYTASTSDESICTAEIKNSSNDDSWATRFVQINPIKSGKVTLYVKDGSGNVNYEQEIEIRQSLPEDAVPFKDVALKSYLLEQSNFNDDGYVSKEELSQVTDIIIYRNSYRMSDYITDLGGLEYASNLKTLILDNTAVTDVTPLSGLTQLEQLTIENTDITDISSLNNLINLKRLDLSGTNISDISTLGNLKNLVSLSVYNTRVSDCSVVSNMSKLKNLYISNTDVSDISAVANLKDIVLLEANSTKISDISALSNLQNLMYVYLDDCSELSSISLLNDLTQLKVLSISGTKVSNAEKLDFMCRNIDKNSYNKGEAISLPGIYGWVSNDDEFNIAATGGDVGSIKIEKDDDNNSFSVVATDTGRVELTVNLNDASKKINIFIDGIPAEQPVGEMDGTTISESEVYEWDSYTEEYNQISSAILTSTGDLWQTYPQKKKMQSNVKKYVSKWIYSQGPAEIVDYRLDNDNVLWSGDTKIQKNIKDFDGHYAITKDNTLIDLFHDKGENISDVKDWSERKKWTLVLKNDGTLLVREEAKKDAKPNSFETIATGVKEIVGEGYLTSSGDYIRIYFNDNGDREYYTIAQNVESVDSKANCFYGKDGNCYLDAYHTGDHINAGKNKVKQWLYLGNDGATYYYYVTDDGRLECITRTYNFDNNKSTYASYSIMDNIVGIQYDSYKVKAESADNIYYEISKVNATKLDNNNIDSFTLDNNEYSLFVKQGQSFGNIQKNGVNILNNVKYIWANCLDVFALRTDGTIWKVTDKPELYIDLNGTDVKPGDIDGDSNVTTKDLMIVLYGVSGRNTLTEEQKVAADIDGDGKVSISDLTRILYYVSGRNTEL